MPLPRLLLGLLSASMLAAAEPARPAGRGAIGEVQTARPGPWGRIEYTRVVLEPPDEFMAADYRFRSHAVWNFPGWTPAQLESLWEVAAVPVELRKQLRDARIISVTPAGLTLRPPAALVRSLPRGARTRIYNTLAALPGNPLQEMPFRFRSDMVDEWLDAPALPDEVRREVRELLYPRSNSLLFSDPDLVLPLLPTAAERVLLIKTLSRKSALLLRLRVGPDTDIEPLVDYWGRGPRRKDVRPLLRSLTRHPQGIALDVAHLLPRFARGLLYTFPPEDKPLAPELNCHWSTMNFFRREPEARFADAHEMLAELERGYERLAPDTPLRFGDVLLLVRPSGEVIHSCVFIADDIVFTKNGYSYQMPWVLATIRDVLAAYPEEPPLERIAYRPKD